MFTGPAHHKRKLSIPDRSRSVSPMPAEAPGQTVFDKYAKYERHRKGYFSSDSDYESSSDVDSDEHRLINWEGKLWVLAETKVTLIRIEETMYVLE